MLALALPAAAQDAVTPPPIVAYTITDGRMIAQSLTGEPGDPRRGKGLFASAGCDTCHGGWPVPGAALADGEIRLWIVAPQVLAPDTAMPPAYAPGQRDGASDPLHGGPKLTAEQIEHIVAYLAAGG
ncbi:MAG: hypothetical protein AAGC57_01375 [Pseudomonadota bacterium]